MERYRKSFLIFVVLLVEILLQNACNAQVGRDRRRPILFRPLRRVVRNFVHERTATVTIVFQHSGVMPRMRWFRQVEPNSLPNAEIPDMINVDGDPRYRVRTLSSHDVTAATLVIQPLVATSFPVKFVTCFSVNDEPFLYQLDTDIEEPTERVRDVLDGIIWLQVPPTNITFDDQGQLNVSCSAKLESESSRFTDELNIYRSYLDRKRNRRRYSGGPQLMSAGCGKIHKDRNNYVEESGKYFYKGRREVLPGPRGHVLYEVSFKVTSGTDDDIGVYTCAGERASDRTYVSSWVYLIEPSPPVLLFLPCDDTATTAPSTTSQPYQVRVPAGRPTCVRCRAYQQLSRPILLRKDGTDVRRSTTSTRLDWHLNVPDGGLSELTITFPNPNRSSNGGLYRCTAENRDGRQSIEFRLTVV